MIWGIMSMVILSAISIIVGYLLGSLNTSLIIGRFYKVDVRQHGSGNAGMTNTLRTLGKKAALMVIPGDLLKGVLAYFAGYFIYGGELGGMLGGTACIIGHIWPAFFGFKGGKGVLTTFAVLLMFDWQIALGLFAVFILILLLTKYVSLGSVTAAFLFPISAAVFGRETQVLVFSGIIALLVILRHHENIGRLLSGTESKFSLSRKK
ncbi:MAG: glycerol-3-phosphate 1-O-acyltransferase PlsY [Clostridiaceae bacterium]|jgi:glycerol-3-phosphate acyltransferase PlsY|nr:glycerol-3-phosphate 1-O-acyltransferase PlsY [Clostridiaceae bacterium]